MVFEEGDIVIAVGSIVLDSIIWTGFDLFVVVPSPRCPCLLFPHAHNDPSFLTASEWKAPHAEFITPDKT